MPDMGLGEFIGHLVSAEARIAEAERHALDRAARIVKAEAKHEIGAYQDQAGQFAAWAELADSTKQQRARLGFPENEPLLRTGELRDSIDHVVGDKEAAVGSNSEIAEYQELGTSRIPPRSFLGGAAYRKAEEVARELGEGVVMSLVGGQVFGGRSQIEGD